MIIRIDHENSVESFLTGDDEKRAWEIMADHYKDVALLRDGMVRGLDARCTFATYRLPVELLTSDGLQDRRECDAARAELMAKKQ